MGQYYRFANIDKQQICERNNGPLKLMEHSYVGNDYCNDILNLLNNEWKGDRIIHVGDYANQNDNSNTSDFIGKLVKDNNLKESVYDWTYCFNDVNPSTKKEIRYVYNHTKKEYIDLYKQPVQWCNDYNGKIYFAKINSFSLLTACGNGLGGGDYFSPFINNEMVGKWAGDSFESSDVLLTKYEYEEKNIIFDEVNKYNKSMFNSSESLLKDSFEKTKLNFEKHLNYMERNKLDITKYNLDTTELLDEEKEIIESAFEKAKLLYKQKNNEEFEL